MQDSIINHSTSSDTENHKKCVVKPDILSFDDIVEMAPILAKYPNLVKRLMHWLWLDKCNDVHRRNCYETGVPFAKLLVENEYKFKLRVDNEEILSKFKEGAFITVSNHPFGSYDGIILLYLVGKYRPDYKVMVNLILNHIQAMRPSFIAVDALATDDPDKRKITLDGLRQTLRQLKEGHPVGFFPAGAVSKLNSHLRIEDRQWQPTVVRLIKKAKVPVVPVFFHGANSVFFNILGLIDWRLRTLRLPRELFNAVGKEVHISVGTPIEPDTIARFEDLDKLGDFLRQQTYQLRNIK